MVPGILVLLVTIIGMFLSAMNVVKEKENGTIEQINVTPIKKYQFITGKLLPFWIVGLVELALGLTLAWLAFNIPIIGSLWLIFLFGGLFLLVVLSFGLIISTTTNTQQQAMFIAWFFLIIFILLSGLFTPVESMPEWAQIFNYSNPIAYFIKVMRMVMLKGSDFADISEQFYALMVYAFIALSVAVWRYRKTV
jgi:ABC-2 type transport system permease protein